MRFSSSVVVPVLMAIVGLDVSGIIGRHDRSVDDYLQLAGDARLAAVGLLYREGEPYASAVLVAPQWALTSHHSLDSALTQYRLRFGEERFTPTQIVLPADTAIADLALLRLDREATVTAAKRAPAEPTVGQRIIVSGFGTSGLGASALTNPRPVGTKWAGTNTIDYIGVTPPPLERLIRDSGRTAAESPYKARNLWYDFDADVDSPLNKLGSPRPTDLEACQYGGDSGGGAFVEDGESLFLVGILADFFMDPRDQPLEREMAGLLCGARSLAPYNAWLDAVLSDRRGDVVRGP